MPLRVLVVDDSALYRKLVSEALQEMPGVEVVGTATDGAVALDKINDFKPDLVTLDLEMPHLGGVQVLEQLRAAQSSVGVVMLSAFTSEGAAATTQALRLGAFDFVLKPRESNPLASMQELRKKLSDRIAAFAHSRGHVLPDQGAPVAAPRIDPPARPVISRVVAGRAGHAEVIVLGVSTGGPEALTRIIPQLPGDLPAPLFIVQHMPPMFTKSLADDLNQRSRLRVYEAVDGQLATPGDCLIAPGGHQMRIERTDAGPIAQITDDPPENSCRPAVDYLFRSAAHHYGARVVAVVLTGMGSDGALGCRLLKRQGATVLAQDKETCVVYGMPCAVIEQGLADVVAPLGDMPQQIVTAVGQGVQS